jgi:hypothetical protein
MRFVRSGSSPVPIRRLAFEKERESQQGRGNHKATIKEKRPARRYDEVHESSYDCHVNKNHKPSLPSIGEAPTPTMALSRKPVVAMSGVHD